MEGFHCHVRSAKTWSSAFAATVLCFSWTTFDNKTIFGAQNCQISFGKEDGQPPPPRPLGVCICLFFN